MIRHVAVVIPAKNEERSIEACLSALIAARARCPVDVSVTLIADSCSDRTIELARRFREIAVFELEVSSVGMSRAFGVRAALEHSGTHPDHVWIANTDADSTVPADWLVRQVELADAGYDAILGSVVPDPEEYPRHLQERWASAHPVGCVRQEIYGANLGVRASEYMLAGGFAALEEHEDVDLVRRLRTSRVLYSDSLLVKTSARLDGRTPGGFAGYLRSEREGSVSVT